MTAMRNRRRPVGSRWALCAGAMVLCFARCDRGPEAVALPQGARRLPLEIEEPSAIAFHPDRNTILVASDEGYLVEFDRQLARIERYEILGDIEGLAVHPDRSTLFLTSEQDDAILEYDLKRRRVIQTLAVKWPPSMISLERSPGNHGLEGLCFVSDGAASPRLFAVYEADPALLVELASPPPRVEKPQTAHSTESDFVGTRDDIAVISATGVGVDVLSDIQFVADLKALVLTSACERIAIVRDLDGHEHCRFKLPGDKPEGLVFLPDGNLLIVNDSGGIWMVNGSLQFLKKVGGWN